MNDIHGAHNSQASPKIISEPFSMQNGRILHVTVRKYIGEGMAEVSAAGRKFIAKLDAPLEAGKEYWMRVQNAGDVLSLSVIQKISGKKDSMEAAQALIRQFHYQTADKILLNSVSSLIDNDIPITGELIKFTAEKINGGNLHIRLPVLIHMLKANLPLSENVLLSLEAGKGQDTFSGLLSSLKERLTALGSAQDTLDLIRKVQNPLGLHLAKQMTIKAMGNALDQSEPFSQRHANFELLRSLGILPKGTTFQNMNAGLKDALSDSLHKNGTTLKQLLDLMGSMRKLISRPESRQDIEFVTSKSGEEIGGGGKANKAMIDSVLNNIFKQASPGLNEGALGRILGNLIELMRDSDLQVLDKNYSVLYAKWNKNIPLSNEGKVFNMLSAGIEAELLSSLKGEELGRALKGMIRTLGLNFESQLHSQYSAQASDLPTLKEKLIRLILQNPGLEIRELAEKLVHKMNHPALMSWDQSSVLNIVQQFPLNLYGRQTDITVQWTGREKEKGRIDSDHCRVLFYLNLGNLNETLVDMNVQNRIISLSIWNENEEISDISHSYFPVLKESLQNMNYQLTSVKFKKVNDGDDISKKRTREMHSITYSGVDMKI
ncbi:hypothetical protein [Rossellomorea aquimaris]|uniref:Flagellar hook-length control protein-like C-terminal domain-containing protein n=1 Tax=Rossellomorea aquimaris TaxID=189382 RepID=A0A1J6W3Q9_9BACI|nr:hypothetical protein [Rossellomorea aquimaris]OIU72245.1 hypothetical protein BHE18_06320 [Rossellomorea aquimaris]